MCIVAVHRGGGEYAGGPGVAAVPDRARTHAHARRHRRAGGLPVTIQTIHIHAAPSDHFYILDNNTTIQYVCI